MESILKKTLVVLSGLVFVLPLVVSADVSTGGIVNTTNLSSLLGNITTAMNYLIAFAIAVAFFMFIVGLIKFVTAGSDKAKRDEGKNTMVYGVIVLVVMLSVFGIVKIGAGLINGTGGSIDYPTIPTDSGI